MSNLRNRSRTSPRRCERAYPELEVVRERRRGSRSTWSAAPSATCCSAAVAPTSTWSSWATPRRWRRGSAPSRSSTSASPPPRSRLDGHEVDIAARPHRGLPPARGRCPRSRRPPDVEADLARRDFTINAMAIPLAGEPRLIDPHGGRGGPRGGAAARPAPTLLRRRPDPGDPRRALRRPLRLRARARDRASCCAATDLGDRLRRPPPGRAGAARGRTERAARGFGLLAEWGLVELREGGVELPRAVDGAAGGAALERRSSRASRRCSRRRWARRARRAVLAASRPQRPSRGGRAGPRARSGRAGPGAGAGRRMARPLPRRDWRTVELEIDGADLIAAGVPAGPGARPRPAGGAAAQARRRDRGPRAGAGRGARGALAASSARRRPSALLRGWSGARATGCAGWRRSSAAARAAFSTRLGGVSEAPFDEPQPRPPHRRRAGRGGREPAAPGGRARLRARADRLRPPGPRRRACRPRRPASPSPFAEPGTDDRPRRMGTSSPSPAWRRWSSPPTACRSPSPGPGGVAMLHCGWRGLAGGIIAAGAEAVGATERRDRPRDRALLLRGRRRGAATPSPVSARGSPRGGCSTCPRWRGGCCARPGWSGSSRRGSARAASRSSSSPTAATRAAPAARRGLAWIRRGLSWPG